jgi:hypothetical protein
MFLITFAEAVDFEGKLGPEMYIAKAGEPLEVTALLTEPKTVFGKHLFQLLRLAWEQMLNERRLPAYELANKARCFYFPKDRVPGDKVFFTGVDGERTYRAMVGYSTRTNPTTDLGEQEEAGLRAAQPVQILVERRMARPGARRRDVSVRRHGQNHPDAWKQGQPDYPTDASAVLQPGVVHRSAVAAILGRR